jgi:hypothetical protein
VEGIQSYQQSQLSQQSQPPSSESLSEREMKERTNGRNDGLKDSDRYKRIEKSDRKEMTSSASVEGSQSSEPPLDSESKPPSVVNHPP